MCSGTPPTGVKEHSEWVSQIPRKCWIKRDSFMLFTSVFLHPCFIDPCYEKRQIIFPDLLQSILQIRKVHLHLSDHQEILSVHKRRHFSSPVTNYYKIQQVSDIYLRISTWEEQGKAMSLPEYQTVSHRGLMLPIFVQRGEMNQAHLTLVCLWISDMYYLIIIKILQAWKRQ